MSVKVNLLPQESKRDAAAQQQRVGAGIAGLVLIGLLGGAWYYQQTRIDDAEQRLAEQQQVLADRQARQGELAVYAELRAEREAADQKIIASLGGEISAAGIMQDLALVFPPNAELSDMQFTVTDPTQAAPAGATRIRYGTLSLSGRTLAGHAPGLEGLLLDIERIAANSNVFFTTATLDQDDAIAFEIEVDLGEEVLTGRYAQGLPEELR